MSTKDVHGHATHTEYIPSKWPRWSYETGWLTSGLQNSVSPTTDHLTPQETTNQDAPDGGGQMGVICPVLVAAW
jgi:hypothetical protein